MPIKLLGVVADKREGSYLLFPYQGVHAIGTFTSVSSTASAKALSSKTIADVLSAGKRMG